MPVASYHSNPSISSTPSIVAKWKFWMHRIDYTNNIEAHGIGAWMKDIYIDNYELLSTFTISLR